MSKIPRKCGLVGLWGHAYATDETGRHINKQFLVLRPMRGDRYVIQYFEWFVGEPIHVGVMTEAELLGDDVRLYDDRESWTGTYDIEARGRRAA